ncbi:MAG: galactokinase [Gemmatimonadota bacterium]
MRIRRSRGPDSEPAKAEREDELVSAFRARFDHDPKRIVRAPGRVNLIGEHVDYAGLPVLPMAIQRAVRMAVRSRDDDRVRVATLDAIFPPREFRIGVRIPPFESGDWGNYVKAAAVEAARTYGSSHGLEAVIASDVPVAAGLSSSAALVIACGLSFLEVAGISFDRLELADRMAEAERYVGTRGGGMDQAISLCAREGHATRIEFEPVRVTHVPVPADWTFVVAFSLERARKSGEVRDAYNRRRAAVETALPPVARRLGLSPETARYPDLVASFGTEELVAAAAAVLEAEALARFRHVVTEAARTRDAETALREGDASGFGRLMDASHASLREDFEVSTPALDAIVGIAREAGATGARLTGAGMGGCAVALCASDRAAGVRDALAARFYAGRTFEGELSDQLFEARPSAGACVRHV